MYESVLFTLGIVENAGQQASCCCFHCPNTDVHAPWMDACKQELPAYSQSVVAAMAEVLQDLYHLGLRNFIVSNIQPGGCIPLFGFAASLTLDTCATDPAGNALALLHNGLLAAAVAGLQSELPQGHFVVLDAFKAFGLVLPNAEHFGACCVP